MESTLATFKLGNSVCLITGGAGFLGEQHARAILDGEGRVALSDISKEALENRVLALTQEYGPNKVYAYPFDITDERAVEENVIKIEKEVGPIDILINNAAHNPQVTKDGVQGFDRFERFPLSSWNEDLAVNLTGPFLLSRNIGTRMAKRKKGVILNIASDFGIMAPDQRIYRKEGLADEDQPVKPVTYSVTKHGIIGLTKYLSTYWPESGVRANTVSFGGVYKDQPEDFVKKIKERIPLGRMAKAEEYRAVVLFLCSDASSYMTGANVVIDGGRTAW